MRKDLPVAALTNQHGQPVAFVMSGHHYRVRRVVGHWSTGTRDSLYRLQATNDHEVLVVDLIGPAAVSGCPHWRIRDIWR